MTPVDEHDETKAEAILVLAVQPCELGEHLGLVAALFGRGLADAGMGSERLRLLVLRRGERDLGGAAERVVGCRQAFHEAGAAGEEPSELVGGQLPR